MDKLKSTVAELKSDIDRGRTGDKVAADDPATVPLGTDDEAAGVSLSPELIQEVRERELEAGAQARAASHRTSDSEGTGVVAWLLIAAFLLAGLAMVWLAIDYS
jgi:hypothetical protein